jgi:hypothetical protein
MHQKEIRVGSRVLWSPVLSTARSRPAGRPALRASGGAKGGGLQTMEGRKKKREPKDTLGLFVTEEFSQRNLIVGISTSASRLSRRCWNQNVEISSLKPRHYVLILT